MRWRVEEAAATGNREGTASEERVGRPHLEEEDKVGRVHREAEHRVEEGGVADRAVVVIDDRSDSDDDADDHLRGASRCGETRRGGEKR